ncbi:hypothetical protein NC651_015528 [Populus alba x Populus x berolinensis]|nr:hypothetical protein NC651_015528 [Populus alba x Populus x berolinensis]
MEDTLKKMVSKGLRVDSATGNAFVMYYSLHGSLAEKGISEDAGSWSKMQLDNSPKLLTYPLVFVFLGMGASIQVQRHLWSLIGSGSGLTERVH